MKKHSHIPPVQKKVKRKELLFAYSLIVVLILFLSIIVIHTINVIPSFTSKINIAGIAGAFIAIYALIWQIYMMIRSQRIVAAIDMNIDIDGNLVIFSCSVTNAGTKSIYPYMVNLYIDEGVYNNKKSIYEFDIITDHTIDRGTGEVFDCHLAQQCKNETAGENGEIQFPKCQLEKFSQSKKYCYNLRQLSHFSLVHIMPGEVFRDDAVIKIENPGVYRATLIYTGKDYDDCICTTKKFWIKGELK